MLFFLNAKWVPDLLLNLVSSIHNQVKDLGKESILQSCPFSLEHKPIRRTFDTACSMLGLSVWINVTEVVGGGLEGKHVMM